jgi:hypothetical protein
MEFDAQLGNAIWESGVPWEGPTFGARVFGKIL